MMNHSFQLRETGCTTVPRVGVKLTVSGTPSRGGEGERAVHHLLVRGRESSVSWGPCSKQ